MTRLHPVRQQAGQTVMASRLRGAAAVAAAVVVAGQGYTADYLRELKKTGADAIGMSGLLVKSTLIMRENLEEMNTVGMSDVPVLLGGAALTRTYVEQDLRKAQTPPAR